MLLLLVEDNDELSKLLVTSLRSADFNADIVATAAEALGVLSITPYSA
jgi:DNA-binding response OmpR family regulator